MIDVESHVPVTIIDLITTFLSFCALVFAWIVSLASFIWIAFMYADIL